MTLFKSTDGLVCGQPMSPFFGAQNGVQGAGAVTIQSPNASANSGVQQPVLAAEATGSMPRNALVNTVNSVNAGGNVAIGGDPVTIDQALTNGNGALTARGASIAAAGAINTQIFADGYGQAAQQGNGAIPKNTSSLTEAPVSGATLTSNIAPIASGFGG